MRETLRAASFLDKGGTGKTTATAHLSVAAAEAGHDVLTIDLAGKQGDLAKQFGVWESYCEEIDADEAWPNIATTFDDAWDTIAEKLGPRAVEDLIYPTDEAVDLVPAHPALDGLDADLGNIDDARERYGRLEAFLDEYIDPLGYDLVLLDLPGLANNVTYNGLWAAKNVISPVEMGPFEAEQADALRADLETITENFGVEVRFALVLPNKVDTRTKLAEEYLAAFHEEYTEAIAPRYIPYSQDIRNATERGCTAFALQERSKTAVEACEAFVADAEALVARLGEVNV
jgi:ATPases involved in chromosome partitioning